MEEILCTGQIDDLDAFIKKCTFPGDTLALIERLPQHIVPEEERQHLLQFVYLRDINLDGSISGRIFSERFELRWQEENRRYRAVYLGEERKIPGLKDDTGALAGLEPSEEPRYYYLFGEYLNPDDERYQGMRLKREEDYNYYAEVRIPRLLLYPRRNAAQRVRLQVREYIEKTTGRVQLFRFQNLMPEEGKA